MWEILKFFLTCIGACCVVSAITLGYMIYKGPEVWIAEEPEDYWHK